jgi:predicted SprT family Zn-dependent metalloprotease
LNNHEFMERATAKANECWDKLEKSTGKRVSRPTILFNLRSRTIAGMSQNGGHTIRFNLAFVKHNGEDMVNQTVPHEIAHAWLTRTGDPSHVRSSYFERKRRSPHGHKFMEVLGFLGGREKRTHNYALDKAFLGKRAMTYTWKCSNCGYKYELTIKRHNKALRNPGCYFHPKCGSEKGKLVRC